MKTELLNNLLEKRVEHLKKKGLDAKIVNDTVTFNGVKDCAFRIEKGVIYFDVCGTEGCDMVAMLADSTDESIINTIKKLAEGLKLNGFSNY